MAELENNDEIPVRTTQQLRADIDKGVSEVQGAKDEWAAALQRQEVDRNSKRGTDTYGQMRELVGRRELAELQNGARTQDAIASALAIAQQNGGRLPSVVTDYLNRQFGFDGKTSGIMDGGIDPNTGEFGFVFGERDEQGNPSYRKQTIPMTVQLGLMEGYPGLFNEDAVKKHREYMLGRGFSSGELDAYSNVARLARDRFSKRMEELTPHDTKLETEKLRQEGMDRRADMRQDQFDQKFALQRQQLEEQVQKRLAATKTAEEKNAILKEAKEAELRLQQEEIERKYAQMGVQYGVGETRKKAQEKVSAKLSEQPAPDKATVKPGDNGGAKEIKGYQYSKDRKRRRAAYADGTFGEPEEVK